VKVARLKTRIELFPLLTDFYLKPLRKEKKWKKDLACETIAIAAMLKTKNQLLNFVFFLTEHSLKGG